METQLAQRVYGNPKKKLVENWIKTQKEDLNNEHKNRGVAIAKEANKIAKKSNQISWWSFIASIFSLLIAILVAIFK